MTQQALFLVEQVDPAETESEAHHIARMEAYDLWQSDYLHSFYTRKAAEILASGDAVRIRLYRAWEAKQERIAA